LRRDTRFSSDDKYLKPIKEYDVASGKVTDRFAGSVRLSKLEQEYNSQKNKLLLDIVEMIRNPAPPADIDTDAQVGGVDYLQIFSQLQPTSILETTIKSIELSVKIDTCDEAIFLKRAKQELGLLLDSLNMDKPATSLTTNEITHMLRQLDNTRPYTAFCQIANQIDIHKAALAHMVGQADSLVERNLDILAKYYEHAVDRQKAMFKNIVKAQQRQIDGEIDFNQFMPLLRKMMNQVRKDISQERKQQISDAEIEADMTLYKHSTNLINRLRAVESEFGGIFDNLKVSLSSLRNSFMRNPSFDRGQIEKFADEVGYAALGIQIESTSIKLTKAQFMLDALYNKVYSDTSKAIDTRWDRVTTSRAITKVLTGKALQYTEQDRLFYSRRLAEDRAILADNWTPTWPRY